MFKPWPTSWYTCCTIQWKHLFHFFLGNDMILYVIICWALYEASGWTCLALFGRLAPALMVEVTLIGYDPHIRRRRSNSKVSLSLWSSVPCFRALMQKCLGFCSSNFTFFPVVDMWDAMALFSLWCCVNWSPVTYRSIDATGFGL